MSLRLPRRRVASPLALVLVSGVLGSGALAATLAAGPDKANTTPVEQYRAAALAGVESTVDALPPSAGETPASTKGFEHVFNFDFQANSTPKFSEHDQGTDIEFYSPVVDGVTRDYAIVGAYDRGAFVFDITDPEKTRFVTQLKCQQRQNDIQIRQFGARWIVMLSNDESGTLCAGPKNIGPSNLSGGVAVFDVTDPRAPKKMYNLRVVDGVHNWTWHPTAPVAWVSTGDLPGGVNHLPVYDFTDVDNPKLVSDLATEGGPHDMTFAVDGKRGYVASENNIRVYDTTKPDAPVLTQRGVTFASYVHGTDPTPDGKTLLVTDESLVLGGFFAARTAVCPGGGISLFDTTGPALKPLSYLVADIKGQTPDHRACTAHVGKFTPDSKHYVTGWYLGGVRLFDISNPSAPTEVGHIMMPRSEVWSAKTHKGQYVFTGDLGRGFDVYRVTGTTLATPPLTP